MDIMNLKAQIKVSWPFLIAVVMFFLLTFFSSILTDYAIVGGTVYILLAATITYACIKASKIYLKKGRYGTCARLIFVAGFLSGLWLLEAIKCFF
jgi:hypothetical protein